MKKQFVSIAMSALAFVLVGCGADGGGNSSSGGSGYAPTISALPTYQKKTPIEIDAWLGPKLSEESMKDYADCGYTVFHAWNQAAGIGSLKLDNEEANRQLDDTFTMAEKYGLKVVLSMTAVNTGADYIVPFEWIDNRVGDTLKKWKDTDTFYGYLVSDESTLDKTLKNDILTPTTKQQIPYDRLVDCLRDDYFYFSSQYPGKHFETTLLGIYDGNDSSMPYFVDRQRPFEEYMECYYQDLIQYMPVEDRVYSFDAYPFSAPNGNWRFHDRFVGSLEAIALEAEKAGAKKATYIQNHVAVLNPEMVSYQYYTSMCYGYTYFTTYCYMNMWGEKEFSVDYDGRKTDNYYYYQKAHERVKSMETVYSNFCDTRMGTMAITGSQTNEENLKSWAKAKNMLEAYPAIKACKATQDLMIGVFKDKDGNDGFMLANQMLPDTNLRNQIELKLSGAKKAAVWIDGKDMQMIELTDETLKLDMESGGGAFVVPMA